MPESGPDVEPSVEELRRLLDASRARAELLAERLAASQEVTAALVGASRVEDVLDVIVEKGLHAFRARGAMVKLPEGETIETVAARGYRDPVIAPYRRLPLDARTPNMDAYRTGEPVWLGSRAAIREAYPGLEQVAAANGDEAWAAIPLVVESRITGVLGLSFAAPMEFGAEDRAFVVSLARKCGHALDRARLFEAERRARSEAESLALLRSRALELEASARARAEAAEAEARRIGGLQEQLTAVVGHDLRTPLSAITLAARLLRRAPLDGAALRSVHRIERSAARMTAMIRDLLDFSRARRGRGIPVEPTAMDAGTTILGAVAEVRAAHPARTIRVATEGDLRVLADAERLAQVATNLVVNALEHGAPAAPVEVTVAERATAVELAVHNDGPPIPETLRVHLFEPFVRGSDDGAGGHLGLGLFIVREIVTAHGGAVEVRSAEGQGTTFAVRLPRHVGVRGPVDGAT